MGFDKSRLFYAIVVADPSSKGNRELRQNVVRPVEVNRSKIVLHSVDGAKIYVNKFDRGVAEVNLQWALQFWKQQREAKPTDNSKTFCPQIAHVL